ncbi:serine/threonine protein kinase [Polytolypa hystricis UAMH7299]|uniref:Serine/threonine-protein kinase ATG1 n=1 Tax=Polytolypa hystricis (strain UAMH7299) TaxID=1447883 RepID=A0A2B7YQH4_POLH7|nr:serine/threonine protein kinase [Polytolypa hystricis UAMH7299]
MDCLRAKFVQGQLLDNRFITVAPLNHGSFGMVFLADDTVTGDQVAIKCLTKPSSTEPSSLLAVDERSEELECHTRLGYHPNIVNLVHSFETNSHIFLVLEYCSMGDLYEAIRNSRGPLQTEHVREFMLQLVNAIEYMHSRGLYHRDIKPENIFLTQDGSMKLGDFGLATASPWSYEACVGSDRYMAPEQYEPTASGYSTTQADIWSIGICLLNILFSRNPFATPSESDILFADYSRDRQSLFDVFPNMSQDTFEILSNAMALDPKKRSLSEVREGILRAVTFTTDDDSLDEFCTEERDVIQASAYREPLRTPSIQSPQINQGDSFPWAKALQSTPPQPIRQLSVIPDTESYTEDLFPASEVGGMSWYSVQAGTPSVTSAFDSTISASFKSIGMRPVPTSTLRPSDPRPISGSLPTSGGRPIPAMSMVFGKGKSDGISKSWSDLWDEEESEQEEVALQQRQEQNSRTWSNGSKEDEATDDPAALSEPASSSLVNSRSSPIDHTNAVAIPAPHHHGDDFEENRCPSSSQFHPSKYSPPKQSIMDKWAALGDKRRKYHQKPDKPRTLKKKRSMNLNWRKDSSASDSDTPTKKDGASSHDGKHWFNQHQYLLDQDWRRDPFQTIKPKKNASPVGHYDGGMDDDEFDFIGGWHDLHL